MRGASIQPQWPIKMPHQHLKSQQTWNCRSHLYRNTSVHMLDNIFWWEFWSHFHNFINWFTSSIPNFPPLPPRWVSALCVQRLQPLKHEASGKQKHQTFQQRGQYQFNLWSVIHGPTWSVLLDVNKTSFSSSQAVESEVCRLSNVTNHNVKTPPPVFGTAFQLPLWPVLYRAQWRNCFAQFRHPKKIIPA